jgi:hypothetical protein
MLHILSPEMVVLNSHILEGKKLEQLPNAELREFPVVNG